MVIETMRDEQHEQHQHQHQSVREKTRPWSRSRRVKRVVAQNIALKYHRAAVRHAEYRRLKAIVPSVADKKSVSKV